MTKHLFLLINKQYNTLKIKEIHHGRDILYNITKQFQVINLI